jgi:hypothetical protein
MIIALGFAAFRFAAKHLPVFEPEQHSAAPAALADEPVKDYAVASQ